MFQFLLYAENQELLILRKQIHIRKTRVYTSTKLCRFSFLQLFFTVTELFSTFMVVHLCCRDSVLHPWKLLVIFDINLMHIIVAGFDQFVANVIFREGQHFEAVRDLGLMAPDVFHVLVAYFELSSLAAKRQTNILRLFFREEILGSFVIIILVSLF